MAISDDQKMANIFIKNFDAIVPKLGLASLKDVIVVTDGIEGPVLKAVNKHQRHPSIFAIKENDKNLNFSVSSVSLSNLQNELKSLDFSKSVHETDTGP